MRVLIAFLIVMCVGNATAADYEYWVDNTLGDNANSGSEGAPWETIRHATSTGLPNGMTAADTVTINIVPGVTYSNADDYIRPEATEMQGCSVVLQSATPGTPYVINGPAQLIWAITTCDLDLEIKDCVATVPRVFHWAGLTTPTANGVRLVIGESCTFTHSDTAAVDFVNFDSDSAGSSLELSGVEINGWASLGFGANLTSARITNITFNAGNCSADTTFFDAATLEITGCELTWPNKVNNVAQFSCLDTNIAFEGNRVAIASTNAANAIQFLAPVSGGSATVELTVRDNVFTGDATGSVLQLGRSLNTSADRATNDATAEQFASVDFTANEITNSDIDGGLVDVFVGCTGAKLSDNFMQVSTVGTSEVYSP